MMTVVELAILLAGVALSVGGVVVVRRLIPQEKLTENNEYAGFTYGILGLIYGIYLAFTVVVVWQQYEDAEEQVVQEIVTLNALWGVADAFPADVRDALHRDLMAYARYVVDTEWALMAPGLYNTTTPAFTQIWLDFERVMPNENDPRQMAFYGEFVGGMKEFAMARRLRVLSSTAELPHSMWVLLVLGAAGTIMFTWFYGTRYLSLQIAVTAFLAVIIIYSVLLVAMLEHPFGGTISVSKRPYLELLDYFEMRSKSDASGGGVHVEPPVPDESQKRQSKLSR